MEKYLVINGGSSSLKFSLYENNEGNYNEIISGVVERIGQEIGTIVLKEKTKVFEKIVVKKSAYKLKSLFFIKSRKRWDWGPLMHIEMYEVSVISVLGRCP